MSNHAASRKHYYTVLLDRTLVCFLLVVVLNFFLPRLLPGNPVAYLTGFSEQDMTPAQVAFYEDALHLNNYVGIIVVYLGFGAGMSVFMFSGFVKGIPMELEEAALIDGCNPLTMYIKVVFPILKPISITVAILNAMWVWNDYLLPYLLIGTKYRTIPVAIQWIWFY